MLPVDLAFRMEQIQVREQIRKYNGSATFFDHLLENTQLPNFIFAVYIAA